MIKMMLPSQILRSLNHRWVRYLGIAWSAIAVILMTHAMIPTAAASTVNKTGFVDIRSINPKIALDIRYATTNNFTKRKLYRSARCILRDSVARQLSQVQTELQSQGLGLKVYDCYRPLSVQKLMWKLVPDERFVANPARGSRHNRGAAVDLTLVDSTGKELEMPTGFDDFTERAYRNAKNVSSQARTNSQKLEAAMTKYGFIPLPTEWWHYDSEDWQQFSVRDISFDAIPQ